MVMMSLSDIGEELQQPLMENKNTCDCYGNEVTDIAYFCDFSPILVFEGNVKF